jgi:hypothetical protein
MTTSLVPPGGYGTTSVTGLVGQAVGSAVCAWAPSAKSAQAVANSFSRVRMVCPLAEFAMLRLQAPSAGLSAAA